VLGLRRLELRRQAAVGLRRVRKAAGANATGCVSREFQAGAVVATSGERRSAREGQQQERGVEEFRDLDLLV